MRVRVRARVLIFFSLYLQLFIIYLGQFINIRSDRFDTVFHILHLDPFFSFFIFWISCGSEIFNFGYPKLSWYGNFTEFFGYPINICESGIQSQNLFYELFIRKNLMNPDFGYPIWHKSKFVGSQFFRSKFSNRIGHPQWTPLYLSIFFFYFLFFTNFTFFAYAFFRVWT